ncbi:hypothetical protein BH11BAC5_BH11BAC5_33560 [soil metagenome]
MKKFLIAQPLSSTGMSIEQRSNYSSARIIIRSLYALLLLVGLMVAGCKKQDVQVPFQDNAAVTEAVKKGDFSWYEKQYNMNHQSIVELLQAKAATEKYNDIQKAFADQYVDINVVEANMGYHFMKAAIADSVFEISKPEILVYNKNGQGQYELVAVEYAVPISATPNKAPEGFTGSLDVWERNTTFGLWLCHAWVWKFNPAGAFFDTNPLVHLN